jgi:hypothetical protein
LLRLCLSWFLDLLCCLPDGLCDRVLNLFHGLGSCSHASCSFRSSESVSRLDFCSSLSLRLRGLSALLLTE